MRTRRRNATSKKRPPFRFRRFQDMAWEFDQRTIHQKAQSDWRTVRYDSPHLNKIMQYVREWHDVVSRDLERYKNTPAERDFKIRLHQIEAFGLWISRNI